MAVTLPTTPPLHRRYFYHVLQWFPMPGQKPPDPQRVGNLELEMLNSEL
jgi:hypothetical protein